LREIISDDIKRELRLLVLQGFVDEFDDRYFLYAEYLENNVSLSDILTIRDIITATNIKSDIELEKILCDMFVAINNGSLTLNIESYNKIDFNNPIYDKLISRGLEVSNPNKENVEFKPVVLMKENGVNKHVGFHRYVIAAIEMKGYVKERLKNNIESISIEAENIRQGHSLAFKHILEKVLSNSPVVNNTEIKPNVEQQIASALALINNFTVISGGPGTGKTTVIFTILRSLLKLGISVNKIALLAPTGRAAYRMKESIKNLCEAVGDGDELLDIKSQTIHSFLGFDNNIKNLSYKVPYDVVIVDEVSMVDICLMERLFSCVSPESKIVLIGDYNQLPSVDAGAVMADLSKDISSDFENLDELNNLIKLVLPNIENPNIESGYLAVLKENHRSVEDLKVVYNKIRDYHINKDDITSLLNNIELDNDSVEVNGHNFKTNFLPVSSGANFIDIEDKEKIVVDQIIDSYFINNFLVGDNSYINLVLDLSSTLDYNIIEKSTDNLNEIFSLINRFRVLCPMKNGIYASNTINNRLLYKYYFMIIERYKDLANGVSIMVTKNDYSLNLFNGNVGVVLKDKHGDYRAVFENNGAYISYNINSLPPYEYAFAMTIHKSQGSEYENVLIPIQSKDEKNAKFFSKELLYTAVTRAKKSFTIVSDKDTINYMCGNLLERENALK